MASLDIPRAAVTLSDAELGAAVMLLAAPDHPLLAEPASQAAVASLEAAGLLEDGRPGGYAARLLAIVAAPKLRISVESYFAGAPRVDQAWATETEGVLGSVTAAGEIELSPVEPSLLPWAIARWVGFGPRAHPDRQPLAVAAADFEAAVEHAPGDGVPALDGLSAEDAERLMRIVRARRLSWRATSAWSDAAGEHVASLAVVDAGSEGLWLSRHEGDPAAPTIHLEPVAPSDVWSRILDLLPHPS